MEPIDPNDLFLFLTLGLGIIAGLIALFLWFCEEIL